MEDQIPRVPKMCADVVGLLTGREREVAHWMGEGKTLEETGIILGISRRTAEKHRDAIYAKLSVANRTEFVLRSFFQSVLVGFGVMPH